MGDVRCASCFKSEHLQPYGVEHPPILAQVYQNVSSQAL